MKSVKQKKQLNKPKQAMRSVYRQGKGVEVGEEKMKHYNKKKSNKNDSSKYVGGWRCADFDGGDVPQIFFFNVRNAAQ